MNLTAFDLLLAWVLDALVGDPRRLPWPHPVVLIGRAATRLEIRLSRTAVDPGRMVLAGGLYWISVVGGAVAGGFAFLAVARWLHPLLGRAASIYLAYACLATRCLDVEARRVARPLRRGRVSEAQRFLAGIVGRDTEGLDGPEIARATIETVAENASDGVVAPLLFLGLGAMLGWGPLLGLAYKAINTLDSMVGYRDEKHEHFGKVAARMDDLANWVPARFTALLTVFVAEVLWRRGRAAARVVVRDGRLHKSPNAGYPEAAFAGALGVGLGGTNTYRGVPRPSPRIGDPGAHAQPLHIYRSLWLLWGVSAAALAFVTTCVALV